MHGAGAAACETVNVLPATLIVPLRAAPVLAATLNDTVPLPVPELPPDTVTHAAFEPAVHAHVAADAVTATDPDPPDSDTDWSAGAMENVQAGGGAAACDTVNVLPPTDMVPLRAPPALAATENETVPFPEPELLPAVVIQDAFDVAVQAQVETDAVIAIEPEPPASEMVWSEGAIVNVHGGGTGGAAA